MATISTSARRVTEGRSRVREWTIVTVALRCRASSATGLPTMFERPTTTTSRALQVDLVVVEQLDHARRRARAQSWPVEHELPDALGVEAVDVLRGIDAGERARLVQLARQRALHEDPVHRRIGVELVDQRVELGLRRRRGQLVVERAACRPRPSARSCAARRSGSRDRRPRAPSRGPAAGRRPRRARALPRRRAREPTGRRPRRRGSVRSWRPRVMDRQAPPAQLAAQRQTLRTGDPDS